MPPKEQTTVMTTVCFPMALAWRVKVNHRRNFCRERFGHLPHSDVAAARNGRGQAADTRKKPPIAVALVPDAALARNRGIIRNIRIRLVIHRGDNASRPRLHLVPRKNLRQHRRIAIRRKPRDKVVILGAAELLGDAHRAPPFQRNRHHAAVLHALQSRHYENRIRAGAGEGVGNRHQPLALLFCYAVHALSVSEI